MLLIIQSTKWVCQTVQGFLDLLLFRISSLCFQTCKAYVLCVGVYWILNIGVILEYLTPYSTLSLLTTDLSFSLVLEKRYIFGLCVCVCVFPPSSQSAAAVSSPASGNLPPGDGMPLPPGFFQVQKTQADMHEYISPKVKKKWKLKITFQETSTLKECCTSTDVLMWQGFIFKVSLLATKKTKEQLTFFFFFLPTH